MSPQYLLHGDWLWFDRMGSPDTLTARTPIGSGTIPMSEWWNAHTRLLHLMALHRCRPFGSRRGGLCTSICSPLPSSIIHNHVFTAIRNSEVRRPARHCWRRLGGWASLPVRRRGGCGRSFTPTEPSDQTPSDIALRHLSLHWNSARMLGYAWLSTARCRCQHPQKARVLIKLQALV